VNWDGFLRLLDIAVIDIALSGDNAIVIGMAAAALPPGKRRWAIIFGGATAIVLRVLLTSLATLLMLIPYLAAGGGVVLVWVVYKLVRADMVGEEEDSAARQAASLRQAIILIAVADFMMSLDNVIAVAGTASGSIPLLIAGLLLSMPLLLTAGGFISMLIDRMRWIVWVGAFAISFTAARMVFEDRGVLTHVHIGRVVVILCSVAAGLLIPAACSAMLLRRAPARSGGAQE
jgi:YjbE family integral membrane protein